MHSSILYVSRSLVSASEAREQWAAIQAVSVARNSLLDLTGLLIVTPDYFTQFLEGEAAPLDCVMASIRADARHADIFETQTAPMFDSIQFPAWRMACFSPSSFVSRHLVPILERHHREISLADASDLIAFMRNIGPDFPTLPTFQD